MTVLTAVRTISLPSGEAIPVLGQGTWHMAEDPRRRREEIAALRLGIELGMSLIDTAEMYADGNSSEKQSRDSATRCSWSARFSPNMRRCGEPSKPARTA